MDKYAILTLYANWAGKEGSYTMRKGHGSTKSPDVEYREIRVKLPKEVYLTAKARCILKETRLSDVITAYLAHWTKSADSTT